MIQTVIFLGLIAIGLCIIIFMMFSMLKQGDERYEMIISKACRNTLFSMLGYLIISVVERAVNVFRNVEIEGINPIWQLLILAIFYIIQLFYYKRKYGA